MRNKLTLDIYGDYVHECLCIISESCGENTLELYMDSVGHNPYILLEWTDYDESGLPIGCATQEPCTYLEDEGYDYYRANPEIFIGNRLITFKVVCDEFTSKPIYFQCVNLTTETNYTVTKDSTCEDTYRVAAHVDDMINLATTEIPGIVQIGEGINVDTSGIISAIKATTEKAGTVQVGDNLDLNENGVVSVPIATAETLGVVKVGNGLTIDADGIISTSLSSGNVVLIDHEPTENDFQRRNCVLVRYDPESTPMVKDDQSCIYSALATYVEITKEIEPIYYDRGDLREILTGGWEMVVRPNTSYEYEFRDDCIYQKTKGWTGTINYNYLFVQTVNAVDLTNYSVLHITCKSTLDKYSDLVPTFGVSAHKRTESMVSASDDVAMQITTNGIEKTFDLDISKVTGARYIFVKAAEYNTIYTYKIWAE